MSIEIKSLRPEEIPALITLAKETFYDSFGHYHSAEDCEAFVLSVHTEEIYQAAISDPDSYIMVAKDGGKLLAYLLAKPTSLPVSPELTRANELSKLYVKKSAQGQKLGAQLMLAWEAKARQDGHLDLVLGVWSENFGAQRFYERHGYSKIADYQLKVGKKYDTDFIFYKRLSA